MDEDKQIGWTMAVAVGVMGLVVLGLMYVPDLRPEQAVLDCDRQGGYWSSETRDCVLTDSPLAGLAS